MPPRAPSLPPRRVVALSTAESTLHAVEVLGCIFSTLSALSHGELRLALWSLTALLTSAGALYLLHRRQDLFARPGVRDWLYAGMRLNRAVAIVGMRRVFKTPTVGGSGVAAFGADIVYFVKALLVNSSILPILLQALVLALPLPLQAAVQIAVASVILRTTPDYCASLAADGMRPSFFTALSGVQARMSALVMAATSGSRGNPAATHVSCTVSLTHLVIVFEVIAPVLYAYHCDCKAMLRSGGSAAGATTRGGEAGGSGGARSPSQAGGSSSASGATTLGWVRGRPALNGRPIAQPSGLLLVLFGVGLSGVLFDVLCTMHFRLQLLQ